MSRKIYALNQEDSQDNSSKEQVETLAEKFQREAEEKVRETLMPEAKAELRKELAKEIEEMKRQAMAEFEGEKRRLADERKTFEEEKRKLEEREKKFQEQIDSANAEIRQKVDNANTLISKANAKLEELKSTQKSTKTETKNKTKQEKHEEQDSQEKQESVGLEEIEKVEVGSIDIGTDDYTLRFREYRKRKIEEYKKITGNNSIEPGPEEMTIITLDNEVIKVTQQDIEKLKKEIYTTHTSNINELIEKREINELIGKRNVRAVIVGDDITYIQRYLFHSINTFRDIIFNENLEDIEDGAFYETFLHEVMLPPKLKQIHFHAFYGCSYLEKATFGENIEYIGMFAFYKTQLREVTIPDTANVGEYAFYDEVKITRKPPAEMRKSRISHQDVARTVTEQLLDEEKIGEVRTGTEPQETDKEYEQRD